LDSSWLVAAATGRAAAGIAAAGRAAEARAILLVVRALFESSALRLDGVTLLVVGRA
jgi:hypothetical protein